MAKKKQETPDDNKPIVETDVKPEPKPVLDLFGNIIYWV